MSVQEEKLRAIADAIREKDGTTEPIPASTFPARIRAISAMPEDMFTISVESSDLEMGTVSGGGIVSKGMNAEVTIKAEPGEGYKFVAWQEDGEAVSDGAEYTLTADRDRTLVATFAERNSSHNLPAGYTELEYVEATGVQYITGVSSTGVRVFAIEFEAMAESSTSYSLWGATSAGSTMYNAALSYAAQQSTSAQKDTIQSQFGTSGITSITLSERLFGRRIYVKQDKVNKKLTVDDEVHDIVLGTGTYNVSGGAVLGSGYTNTSSKTSYTPGGKAKIYSYQLSTVADGTINQNNIPCIQDSTGIAGFYDIINNVFRKSSSTTAFVAGPAL